MNIQRETSDITKTLGDLLQADNRKKYYEDNTIIEKKLGDRIYCVVRVPIVGQAWRIGWGFEVAEYMKNNRGKFELRQQHGTFKTKLDAMVKMHKVYNKDVFVYNFGLAVLAIGIVGIILSLFSIL